MLGFERTGKIMALKSEQHARTRSILVTIIVASVACYCVGIIFLQVGNQVNQPTRTPTITQTATVTYTSAPPLTRLQLRKPGRLR